MPTSRCFQMASAMVLVEAKALMKLAVLGLLVLGVLALVLLQHCWLRMVRVKVDLRWAWR